MEMYDLEPIQFGPNDDDRVKDMFEKVFLVEFELSRTGTGTSTHIDNCLNTSNYCASEAAKIYRAWLKEQASCSQY